MRAWFTHRKRPYEPRPARHAARSVGFRDRDDGRTVLDEVIALLERSAAMAASETKHP